MQIPDDSPGLANLSAGGKEGKMSAGLALCIAVLTLGSCFACYMLGRDSYRNELRDFQERKRRWEEFDDQD